MNQYRLTNKCLPYLAIANTLLIVILFWAFHQPLMFAWAAKHDGNTGAWLLYLFKMVFYYIGIQLFIYLASAVCFFKKYRLALFLFTPYAIYMLPQHFAAAYHYYLYPLQSNTALYLSSIVYTYSNIVVIILTLVTCFIYTYEIFKKNQLTSLS